MSQSFVNKITSLVIPNNGTASNVVSGIKDARGLAIFSPILLSNVRVQVALSATALASNHVDLTSGGATVKVQTSSCVVITEVAYLSIRLFANSAVTAAKTFLLGKRWEA